MREDPEEETGERAKIKLRDLKSNRESGISIDVNETQPSPSLRARP